MTFRATVKKVHLWLGYISAPIVFIVCLTGAVWALKIHGWVGDSEKTITEQSLSGSLPPSVLSRLAKDSLQGNMPNYVIYSRGKAVQVGTYGKGARISLTMHPVSGELIDVSRFSRNPGKEEPFDFWHFIRRGHRALWLPWEIGRPIVNYGTLVFVVVLITGIFLWFPKSKRAAGNKLWFNWKKTTGIKRKVFDLHAIIGFYTSVILIVLGLTGMVWGLKWWSEGLYAVTTGGRELVGWNAGASDSLSINSSIDPVTAVDRVFEKMIAEYPEAASIQLYYPDTANALSTIQVSIYPEKGKYYNGDSYSFDRYTLQEIKTDSPYNGRYQDQKFGDKLRRMNYDIHIGSIWGNFGRILVFLAALLGTSLPFTGAYLYRKKKKKGKECKKEERDEI